MSESKTKIAVGFAFKTGTIAVSSLKAFWKWYISGFVGHSHKKFYFPRMVRLALTVLILAPTFGVIAPYIFKPDLSSESSSIPSSALGKDKAKASSSTNISESSSISGKVNGRLCAQNLNQSMGVSANASFDSPSKTMNVTVSDMGNQRLTEQEFKKISAKFADSIFSTCYVQAVNVYSSSYSVVIKRP